MTNENTILYESGPVGIVLRVHPGGSFGLLALFGSRVAPVDLGFHQPHSTADWVRSPLSDVEWLAVYLARNFARLRPLQRKCALERLLAEPADAAAGVWLVAGHMVRAEGPNDDYFERDGALRLSALPPAEAALALALACFGGEGEPEHPAVAELARGLSRDPVNLCNLRAACTAALALANAPDVPALDSFTLAKARDEW